MGVHCSLVLEPRTFHLLRPGAHLLTVHTIKSNYAHPSLARAFTFLLITITQRGGGGARLQGDARAGQK